jgi:S1-C subfamily serine protease
MSKQTDVFSSIVLAALLGLVSIPINAAESDQAVEPQKKSAASQADLERQLADARKRLDEAAREVTNLSMSLSDDMVPGFRAFGAFGGPPRAVLGINLGTREDAKTDGVEVVSVSPGGAAEGAGLKAGDVLTDVNGTALKRDGDESAREKLLSTMRKVKPGDSVAISYRRDGKVLKTNLVAQSLKDHIFTMAIPRTPPIGPIPPMHNFGFRMLRSAEAMFGSAELVALTPKLGQYFGTETGLLVVHAPEDTRLKLEDGDVIVDIDGRKPSSPSHALRILTSYQEGERVKLNILRAKKRMTLDVTVPEDSRSDIDSAFKGRRLKRGDGMFEKRVHFGPSPVAPGVPPQPEAGAIAVEPLPEDPV